MRRWALTLFSFIAVVAGPLALSGAANAQVGAVPPVSAKAVEVLDGQSGKVLYEKNARERVPMASVTKLMTLYLAVRAIDQHRMRLTDLVPVTEEAYRVNGSQIWLEPGERISVDHLLRAIAVGSANDAAYALGEYIAGSPDAFVEDMNQTARALGMVSTHFSNPHGLHQPDHYSTAHDLGLLAERAVRMPLLLHYTGMREDRSIRNGKGGTLWMINHNRLLAQFPGMDGLKTGYTSQAGFCIVATAKRQDTRMIAVVLGAPSSKARFADASGLLSWGFQNYRTMALAAKGAAAARIAVRRGAQKSVAATYGQDSYLTLERGAAPVKTRIERPASLEAPVSRGQIVGHLIAIQNGREVARVPLVAQAAVPRIGWIGGVWKYVWKIAG